MISFISGSLYWLNLPAHKVMADFFLPTGAFTYQSIRYNTEEIP